MLQRIADLRAEIEALTAADAADVEALRIKYLSKKGLVSALMNDFRSVPADQKRAVGQAVNELKTFATDKINGLRDSLSTASCEDVGLDLTRTASPLPQGPRHPLSLVRGEIIAIFRRLG
ncbi:MAG: phenylalanine--tRNA ligase subunit alpha, partial [Muribaculaceae bacterium]|nr:phenylalanine--tRNA ligase subunit alpha [Muribaculaceae bacterium]